MLKLHSLIVLGLLIIAGVAAAAPSAHMVTIKVSSGLGAKILVSPSGMTLYHYIDEKKRSIECTGSCAKLWPPLLAGSAKPVAGRASLQQSSARSSDPTAASR